MKQIDKHTYGPWTLATGARLAASQPAHEVPLPAVSQLRQAR